MSRVRGYWSFAIRGAGLLMLLAGWLPSLLAQDAAATPQPTVRPPNQGTLQLIVRTPPVPAPQPTVPRANAPAVTTDGEAGTSAPDDGQLLSFDQEKVVAQMSELEERMYRLAETLRELEPENSSRLRLGLKFAREELIRQEMLDLKAALAQLELQAAAAQQKAVLTKLQRLQELLLSVDLDFQLKLERLRQIREIIRQLDVAIKEESRERQAAEALARQAPPDASKDFEQLRDDQSGNRRLSDTIGELIRGLGEIGARAQTEVGAASRSMSSAEQSLAQQAAQMAAGQQQQAQESLERAKQELEEEAERLLDELRAEVRQKTLQALAEMLEKQIAVRQATEALAPLVTQGSRQALTSVEALAANEEAIAQQATDLLTLVEETEFAIALPAALYIVRDEMGQVQLALAAGDASSQVVELERQIVADLEALIEAMRQMPGEPAPRSEPSQGGQRDRRRELNRLIAELKLVRMMQVRVNGSTRSVDQKRTGIEAAQLSDALKDAIEDVEMTQDDIQEATRRIAEERADEIQTP